MANLNIPINLGVKLDTASIKEASKSLGLALKEAVPKLKISLDDTSLVAASQKVSKTLGDSIPKIKLGLDDSNLEKSYKLIDKTLNSITPRLRVKLDTSSLKESSELVKNTFKEIVPKLEVGISKKSLTSITKLVNDTFKGVMPKVGVVLSAESLKEASNLVKKTFKDITPELKFTINGERLAQDIKKINTPITVDVKNSLSAISKLNTAIDGSSKHITEFNNQMSNLSISKAGDALNSFGKLLHDFANTANESKNVFNSISSALKNMNSAINNDLISKFILGFQKLYDLGGLNPEFTSSLEVLNIYLTELNKYGKSATKTMTKLKETADTIKFDDTDKELVKLSDSFEKFYNNLSGNKKQLDALELESLFSHFESKDYTGAYADLSDELAKTGNTYKEVSSEVGSVFSSMSVDLDGMVTDLEGTPSLFSRIISSLASVDYASLLKSISSGASKVYSALKKITKLTFTALIKSVKTLGSALSVVLSPIGLIKSAWGSLVSQLSRTFNFNSILNATKEAITLSSDLIEVSNVVSTIFEGSSDQILSFAENATESFGLTSLAAQDYASQLGAFFKSSGVAEESIADMSLAITGLIGDMASLRNMADSDVFAKFASGLAGHTMALQSLGVTVSNANLQQFAMERGIDGTVSAMTSADKVMLRYYYIIQQLDYSIGDFVKTQGSWANQIRLLTVNAKTLGATLGQILQKWLYPFVVGLNTLIARFQKVATWLTQLFGATVEDLKAQQGLTDEVNRTPDLGAFAGGYDDIADNIDDATDAQKALNKEQKKSLANIHQLNILSSPSSTSSSSGSGSSGGSSIDWSAFSDIDDLASQLSDKWKEATEETDTGFDEFMANLKKLVEEGDFEGVGALLAQKLNEELKKVDFNEMFAKLRDKLSKALRIINGFVENFDWDVFGAKVAQFFNGLVSLFIEYVTTLDFGGLGRALATAIKGALVGSEDGSEEGFNFDQLAEAFVGAFLALRDFLVEFVTNFPKEELVNGIKAFFSGVVQRLSEEVETDDGGKMTVAQSIGVAIADAVNLGIDILKEVLTSEDFANFVNYLWEIIKTAIENIDWQGVLDGLKGAFSALPDELQLLIGGMGFAGLTSVLADFGSKLLWLLPLISPIVGALKTFLAPIGSIISGIAGMITKLLSWKAIIFVVVANIISNIIQGKLTIQDIFDGIFNFIKNIVTDIIDIFTGITGLIAGPFEAAVGLITLNFEDIVSGVKLTVNGAITAVEGVLNLVIDVINGLISALNTVLDINIPDWIPGIGGLHFGLNLDKIGRLSIPRLAKGAVIPPNNQFLAVLGDQKRGVNIETPLETMLQAFRGALAEGSYAEGVGDIIIPIYINNELSSEEIIRKQDIARYRSNGK